MADFSTNVLIGLLVCLRFLVGQNRIKNDFGIEMFVGVQLAGPNVVNNQRAPQAEPLRWDEHITHIRRMVYMSRGKYRRRNSLRLQGWDYRNAGAYFVTICTHQRQPTFGKVVNRRMRLNSWGQIVVAQLIEMEKKRDHVVLDEFICMPNHLHAIIWIMLQDKTGGQLAGPSMVNDQMAQQAEPLPVETDFPNVKPGSLGAIVRGFKSAVTNEINGLRGEKHPPIWQRGYHDRIIRNERELNAIREYIRNNPANWQTDHEWDEGLDDFL